MTFKFLKSGEKKKLLAELKEAFGIESLDFLLVETGKSKVRGFSGDMTRDEIRELGEIANVEIIGLYLIKKDDKFGLRLGFDGTKLFSEQIRKKIIKLKSTDVERWMDGDNLNIVKEKGVYVVSSESGDMLGCGISDGKKIINYVPKERRARRGH